MCINADLPIIGIIEFRFDHFVFPRYLTLAVKNSNKFLTYAAIQEYTNLMLIDSD